MRKSLLLLSFVLAVSGAWAESPKTVHAEQFGYLPENGGLALQKAIDSAADVVVVGPQVSPWILHDTVKLRSNQKIHFMPGTVVQAAKGKFKGRNASLFEAKNCRKLIISGYGAILEMWGDDYRNPAEYQKSEWRNGISFYDCSDVEIEGITIRNTGGDGIYLGASGNGVCENIKIVDVTCDGNHRQGISVISAENLLLERCLLMNTSGADPMAGIDFEPNRATQRLVNIVMRNCVVANNKTLGLHFCLYRMDQDNSKISILFENCVVLGGEASVHVGHCSDSGPSGEIIFRNCVFSGASQNGIRLRDKAEKVKTIFENCVIHDIGSKILRSSRGRAEVVSGPISLYTIYKRSARPGGVQFKNCLVEDRYDRPFLIITDPIDFAPAGYNDISGNIGVTSPYGAKPDIRTKVKNFDLEVNGIKINP